VQNLKAAVGQQIYIAEVNFSGTHLSMTINSTAFELLAVQNFPKHNPQTGLLPHFILLDDGRVLIHPPIKFFIGMSPY